MSDCGLMQDHFSTRQRPADLPSVRALTKAENEYLTRVSGNAPMGVFLRQNYWLPAIQSFRLMAGGMPLRVRLLGQNYVAFRADDGRVGIFNEHCPHRRVSLTLARNEDNALRCIYHGWKYGVDGTVLETPTQPYDQAAFCKKVPLQHYQTHEAAGLTWVFLGKNPPPFPDFEFTKAGPEQVATTHKFCRFNWVQSLDGLLDSAHIGILHQDFLRNVPGNADVAAAAADAAPEYEFMERAAGFRFAAIRRAPGDKSYFRVSEFVAPFYSFIAYKHGYLEVSVPADDYSTDRYLIQWNLHEPLKVEANALANPADWPSYLNHGEQDYWGQNRAAMARGAFSGFDIHAADLAVAESQGPVSERSKEFLSDGDAALHRMRRLLIDSAKSFEAGITPAIACHDDDAYSKVWVGDMFGVQGEDWRLKTC